MNFLNSISGKNLSFLIGSGASSSIYKTLNIGSNISFEEILTHPEMSEYNEVLQDFYFFNWIECMHQENTASKDYEELIKNYKTFVTLLVEFLDRESKDRSSKINVFTTNYDLLFERAFDELQMNFPFVFFNDGSSGFEKRALSISNYDKLAISVGTNESYQREIPNINLYKLHGSISWFLNDNENINISYISKYSDISDDPNFQEYRDKVIQLDNIFEKKYDKDKLIQKLEIKIQELELSQDNEGKQILDNWKKNNNLIINPTKWKFHQTVMENHYYQLLRLLSFELEKKQNVLIVFGFSFADEHIKEIIKRSLNNNELIMYVITYSGEGAKKIKEIYGKYNNVKIIPNRNDEEIFGDFNYLNKLLKGDVNDV